MNDTRTAHDVDDAFEARLRERLRDAAEQAPAFPGLDTATSQDAGEGAIAGRPRRRPHRWLAAAAAVLILAGGGGAWWSTHTGSARMPGQASGDSGDGGSSSGGCIAALKLDGRTYYGWGDLTRTPRAGELLGAATVPACADDSPARQIRPFALPGVPVATAVFAEGTVWVNRSLSELGKGLPPALRDLTRPVRCDARGVSAMAGTVVGISTMPTGKDDTVRPPYSVTFVATRGDGLPLDRYRQVSVRLRVTPDTHGVGPDLLRAALDEGKPVTAQVRCDGTRFVASALRLGR